MERKNISLYTGRDERTGMILSLVFIYFAILTETPGVLQNKNNVVLTVYNIFLTLFPQKQNVHWLHTSLLLPG